MHAMQYEITLPADYDMAVIRKRVADKGHLTDAFPGLALKAYLVRERSAADVARTKAHSTVNQYAPFYLWRTPEGMNSFLWGPGFRGLSADFGRPQVQHWLGAGFRPGPAVGTAPVTATRHTEAVPEDTDPGAAIERALAALPDDPDLHSTAVALDPSRWQLLHLALWRGPAPEEAPGTRYQVLHLSRPELDALPAGRHW